VLVLLPELLDVQVLLPHKYAEAPADPNPAPTPNGLPEFGPLVSKYRFCAAQGRAMESMIKREDFMRIMGRNPSTVPKNIKYIIQIGDESGQDQ
jgi:hypothetical protein